MAENTDLAEATNGSFNVPEQQSETQPPPQAPGTSTGAAGAAGGTSTQAGNDGDALDKGLDFLERKAGHEQSHSTTEKISDGLRKGFKKMTGKDVPVQDKTYS